MISNEIAKEKTQQNRVIGELAEQIAKKGEMLELLQTPATICREYLETDDRLKTAVNKKRKDLERQMQKLRDQYRYIADNCKTVKEYDILVSKKRKEESDLADISGYISYQVKNVVDILVELGFVRTPELGASVGVQGLSGDGLQCPDNQTVSYVPTLLGNMAADIAEIHPIVFTQLLHQTDYLAHFSTKQLVGLFSCFTDMKVSQDMKTGCPNSKDPLLQTTVEKLDKLIIALAEREYAKSMDTGINYNSALMYDLIDQIAEWCDCETEQDCKYYIQQVLGHKGISVGDFSKGILKIATIAKEIGSMCEKRGHVELQHKLSNIEPMILKYITTTQSLYV